MKNGIFLFSILLITFTVKAQVNSDAIVGKWLTQSKDGTIEIYKQDNKYFGKILSGNKGNRKDDKNPNPKLRSRELIGLTILANFVFNGSDKWIDGQIYDPNSGKTYSCNMKFDKEKLEVRGYIGVSLFGRTEVWTRVK